MTKMEIYNKINDACSILCEYCESNECDYCMVSRLNDDAYIEAVNDIVDSEQEVNCHV